MPKKDPSKYQSRAIRIYDTPSCTVEYRPGGIARIRSAGGSVQMESDPRRAYRTSVARNEAMLNAIQRNLTDVKNATLAIQKYRNDIERTIGELETLLRIGAAPVAKYIRNARAAPL